MTVNSNDVSCCKFKILEQRFCWRLRKCCGKESRSSTPWGWQRTEAFHLNKCCLPPAAAEVMGERQPGMSCGVGRKKAVSVLCHAYVHLFPRPKAQLLLKAHTCSQWFVLLVNCLRFKGNVSFRTAHVICYTFSSVEPMLKSARSWAMHGSMTIQIVFHSSVRHCWQCSGHNIYYRGSGLILMLCTQIPSP